MTSSDKINFKDKQYYTNRELSWLDFNDRVLEESRDKDNPLLERLDFLAITQSNLDEFFSVRVASLSKLVEAKYSHTDASGMTPKEQIDAVNERAHKMVTKQYTTLSRSLLPALNQIGVHLRTVDELTESQFNFIKEYFDDELYPVLTPMADDTSRPFPFISNESLNLAILLIKDGGDDNLYANLQIPNSFSRVVKLPDGENEFILLEEIIKRFVGKLFDGYHVTQVTTFQVVRDMDLDVAEQDASDLLKKVQQQLKLRERGHSIRLSVEASTSKKLRKRLIKQLKIEESEVYRINGPIDLNFLKKLTKQIVGHDDLKYKPFTPFVQPELDSGHNIFNAIKEHDWLMQHPYDKFDPVIEFIKQSSEDAQVLAIKMTLYRVSGDSPIIKYLGRAAQNGKQVTVLVEVKARFDEENNVHWARQLEKMGCHVIYGLVGLKTHSKISLVVRKEADGIRRYMHLGTGNYNDVTAHFYTDIGLFTADNDFGIDMTNTFNMLTGYSRPPYFHRLRLSPNGIREFITEKLAEATEAAQKGNEAHVQMKMNSLSDRGMIAEIYKAAHAGVKVDLLIRGICCLKTGIPDISENVTVHSIVGRFLEHSRMYIFHIEGVTQVYLSSADLMTRNLNRRVEQLFPVNQADLLDRVVGIFNTMWNDNVKTRELTKKGNYQKIDRRGKEPLNAQDAFVAEAEAKGAQQQLLHHQTRQSEFKPLMSPANQPDPFNDPDK